MTTSSPRPLPTLVLPSAHVRLWAKPGKEQKARETVRAYGALQGVVQLGDLHLAVVPELGREHIFEDAVGLGHALLARLRQLKAEDDVASVLLFPGQVLARDRDHLAVHDELIEDLDKKGPQVNNHGLYLTGYAANFLRGRHELESAGFYAGKSGRRVPIHRLVGEAVQVHPWHNPMLLGRDIRVPRPELADGLASALGGRLWVTGPLGSGKRFAVWHFLDQQPGLKIWARAGRSLFGKPGLVRRLVTELYRSAAHDLPAGAAELRRPESLQPARAAELLVMWMSQIHARTGAPIWIVCEGVQLAVGGDLELITHFLANPKCGPVVRLVLIGRHGGALPSWKDSLPELDVGPMSEAAFAELGRRLVDKLSMPQKVERRMLDAAGGLPFPLEESLLALIHSNVIRRVYGAFFFGGTEDTEYAASQRLVRHVEAELRRLGDPLPLRILAAAESSVSVDQLAQATAGFGVALHMGWQRAFTASGWLHESPAASGSVLVFACEAYRRALLGAVGKESVEALRQALGQVVMAASKSSADTAWQAYQLLSGSPDALVSLLQLSRKGGDGPVSREQIFAALTKEYQSLRQRGGDENTELDLLWKLLPLAHHVGNLATLEDELERALDLAAADPARFSALALLKAEYNQDQGRFREAAETLRKALELSSNDEQRGALLLLRCGKMLVRQERYSLARKVLRGLLEVVDRHGPTVLGAHCRFYLGNVALYEGDLDQAFEHHGRALELRQEHQLVKPVSASLAAHGALALARGDYPGALQYFRKAADVLAEDDDEAELSFALVGLGRALGQLGNHTAASKPLRRALNLREGRGNRTGEGIARLELAINHFELGHNDAALKEARIAHFQLSLVPEASLLGDVEFLLGKILFPSHKDEAEERFREALRIHIRHGNHAAAALDSSWLLEMAIHKSDLHEVSTRTTDLDSLVDSLPHPLYPERIHFRLFRAFDWLRRRNAPARDPVEELRKAHRELMRKTGFLKPEERHLFLFHIRENQEILDAAAEHHLSMPSFSTRQVIQDASLR